MISFIPVGNDNTGRLWKALEKEHCLNHDQFKEAVQKAKESNQYLTEVILEDPRLAREKLLKIFSKIYNIPEVRLKRRVIVPFVLNLIPKEVAEQHSVVIFKKRKNEVFVATTTPENTQTIDFIQKKTGFKPRLFITLPEDIRHALRKYKSELSAEFAQIIEQSMKEALAVHDTIEKMANFVPIIKMVNAILERALFQRASDIHLEPAPNGVIIRFRIDGLLHKIVELPQATLPALVARFKLMANLKIDEHRRPQDGRFKFQYGDRDVAVRMSVVPTLHGAKIVLRLLDTQEQQFTLRKLGLNQKDLVIMKEEIQKPHGMILVTGPTGSGKTTTLYSLLRMLNTEEVNICTIEDPIEYGLNGINQMQINPDGGVTFATGLRSLLRQDPNILMVGEIRDIDTATIAMNAAMTGHLVLSTLHTNNAFQAPHRLIEMGVQPYLVASVTNVIIGQRLVRKVCKYCKVNAKLSSKVFDKYRTLFDLQTSYARLQKRGFIPTSKHFSELKLSYGRGCERCAKTGYSGRIGIYEILRVDDEIAELILKNISADAVRLEVLKHGALTMVDDGLLKIFSGQTTFDEVLRVTKE